MILIGRGLDLGEKGTGKREQGTGEAEAEPGNLGAGPVTGKMICWKEKRSRKSLLEAGREGEAGMSKRVAKGSLGRTELSESGPVRF